MIWDEIISPSINSLELIKRKAQDYRAPKEQKPKVITGLKCAWCGEAIEEETYYQCCYHRTIHCQYCATKTGEFRSFEFPVCKQQRIDQKDCIWNMKQWEGE